MISLNDIPSEMRPSIDELPGELSRIASEIDRHQPGKGVEMTIFLAQVFRGQLIYFRNVDYLERRIRDDAIRREYDTGGFTALRLASRWNLSQQRIKEILAHPGGD